MIGVAAFNAPNSGAARQGSLREHNLRLLLRHIVAADRPRSRADLAAATGLTRATVSALVDDLIGGGLLTEVGPAPRSGAGRPAVGLVLADHGPAGLGLEINVDYLAACVVDLTGGVRYRSVQPAELRQVEPRTALSRLASLAAAAHAQAERQNLAIAGATLAVPGLVTPDGVVRLAPNLGWRGVDVAAGLPLSNGLHLPLVVENEANLAAIGELHAVLGSANFVYVSGEIGIGAGIVLDGALFRGARGFSGELGHVTVRPDGPRCRCGARGCLERYAGQEAILAAAGLGAQGLSRDRAVSRLADLAATGDPATRGALTAAGRALGVALAGVVNLLDVDTVVLGGSYAPLAAWLQPAVEREISRRVLTAAWSPVAVRPALLGPDAAMLGAAGSVVRTLLDRPAQWLAAATTTGRG
ncbi:MAG TPA: ROK family transcriptional regulator [Micromonosporaceae bacterium]|nr:ROK family transcriptional regulator [Micromonosporaceae bacterium]